jgi:hypothetical protein
MYTTARGRVEGRRYFNANNGTVRRGHGSSHERTRGDGGRRNVNANNAMMRRGYGSPHAGTGADG